MNLNKVSYFYSLLILHPPPPSFEEKQTQKKLWDSYCDNCYCGAVLTQFQESGRLVFRINDLVMLDNVSGGLARCLY